MTDLGVKTKAEVLDPAVAEAAFSAELNKPVLVTERRARAVDHPRDVDRARRRSRRSPRRRRAFARISPTRAAREQVHDLYDQVEDERAGGATLEEAATKLKLPYRVVEAVSADLQGARRQLRSPTSLTAPQVIERGLRERRRRGEQPDPRRRAKSGSSSTCSRSSRRATARSTRCATMWSRPGRRAETETADRRRWRIRCSTRLKSGASLASLAAEIKKPVQTVENVKRNAPPPTSAANAVEPGFRRPGGPRRQCRWQRPRSASCSRSTG